MANNSRSPSPITSAKGKPKTMDFMGAIGAVVGGKKVHRLEWEDKEFYGVLKDELLKLHRPGGKFYPWHISEGDLIGTDWVVL